MKPETIAKARTMLSSVLLDGLSYREAGAPFGVGRSTVERSIKSLVLEVARERGIPELDEDGLSCLPRLRQFREPVLRAVAAYTPAIQTASASPCWSPTKSLPVPTACACAARTPTGTSR
jgi:hypothetical protein